MAIVQVFDPPMCCSTGVCGPKVNPALTRFAADVHWLKSQGVRVERFNLAQEPGTFAKNPVVDQMLAKVGAECLPLILVDGHVVSQGVYPLRDEMAAFAGIAVREPAGTGRASSLVHLTTRSHRPSVSNREEGCCGGDGCCG